MTVYLLSAILLVLVLQLAAYVFAAVRREKAMARALQYNREQYNALVDIAMSTRKSIPLNRL